MKFFNILNGGIFKVFHFANYCPVVGMPFRIQIFGNHPIGMSVRLIVVPLSFFILNDVLLDVKGFLSYRVNHVAHAVRLEPEDHFEGIFRNNLKIGGSIIAGSAIQGSSCIFDHLEKLVFAHMFRTLKHHVFKKMGKTCTAFHLAV